MSVELADFWENVLDTFSCFYIEITYSSFTFCGARTLSFFGVPNIFSKTSIPPMYFK